MLHSPPQLPPRGDATRDADKPPVITSHQNASSILEDSGVFRAAIPPMPPSHVVRPPQKEPPADAGPVDLSFVATLRMFCIEPRFHVPLASIVLPALMAGVVLGVWFASVMRPDRRVDSSITASESDSETIQLWGRLATSPPDVRGDSNARVILIPARAHISSPMRTSEANEPFTQIIELGGTATRAKSDGMFTLEVPAPQRYLLLAISAGSERDDNVALEASAITQLRPYFIAPDEVIGKSRFHLRTIEIDANTPPLLHVF